MRRGSAQDFKYNSAVDSCFEVEKSIQTFYFSKNYNLTW